MRARLGDLTKIKTGKLDANAASPDGQYPFFTCSKETLRISSYRYDCECVLVAGNGDLNVKYYNGKFDAYQRTYIIESRDKATLFVPYLYYFLDGYVEILREQSIGGVIKYIKLGNLTEAPLPLPELNTQKRIARCLERLENLISLRKQQLDKLDELVKVRFVEMFGDPTTNSHGLKTVPLSEIANYFNGLTYKPEQVSDNGTIVLRAGNIQNNQLDFADIVRVNCPIKERLFVKENDILMCSRNGSARLVGKTAVIKGLREPMTFGAFMMIIRSKYHPYLMTYFQTGDFRRQIKTGATTTINQITSHMLDEVVLPVPELRDMVVFATFTEGISLQKQKIQQSLAKLETLKKSLMQQYFG